MDFRNRNYYSVKLPSYKYANTIRALKTIPSLKIRPPYRHYVCFDGKSWREGPNSKEWDFHGVEGKYVNAFIGVDKKYLEDFKKVCNDYGINYYNCLGYVMHDYPFCFAEDITFSMFESYNDRLEKW